MKNILEKLIQREHLREEEIMEVMDAVMEGQMTTAQIGGFITALRMKGETVEEIAGCARVMRSKSIKVETGGLSCLDTCGTGGDGSNTYNVSTASAFVLAAAGVSVAKHGNRSVSSKCGSADVLEALGARVDLPPKGVEKCIKKVGIGFLYAPVFHQAMKHAIGPRRELGIRTIFNILGPLTNPAGAKRQVLGVYSAALTRPMAVVLKKLGVERAMVVHGMDGLDEITVTDRTFVSELKDNGEIVDYIIDPKEFGIPLADPDELRGNDPDTNAGIINKLFDGMKGAKRNMLVLNSGAALYVAGKANSIAEGIDVAGEIIDQGLAGEKLMDFCSETKGYLQ